MVDFRHFGMSVELDERHSLSWCPTVGQFVAEHSVVGAWLMQKRAILATDYGVFGNTIRLQKLK